MKQTKSIAEVLNKEQDRPKIKDYAKIQDVYKTYWDMHYLKMTMDIRRYGSFVFFRDLAIYLHNNYKNPHFKKFVYDDIGNIYLSQL